MNRIRSKNRMSLKQYSERKRKCMVGEEQGRKKSYSIDSTNVRFIFIHFSFEIDIHFLCS